MLMKEFIKFLKNIDSFTKAKNINIQTTTEIKPFYYVVLKCNSFAKKV